MAAGGVVAQLGAVNVNPLSVPASIGSDCSVNVFVLQGGPAELNSGN